MSDNTFYDDGFELLDEEGHRPRPQFEDALDSLKSGKRRPNSAALIYGLSHLTPENARIVEGLWPDLDTRFRQRLVDALVEISETNFELNYDSLAFIALSDADERVRKSAIELLWENETEEVMDRFIAIIEMDGHDFVRAEAVKALGRFILKGELGEMSAQVSQRARDCVTTLLHDDQESIAVRRRALEAYANCSDEGVAQAIDSAYKSQNSQMRMSAVFAMGKSCDPIWNEIVLQELSSPSPEMRYEAARASGELEISEAVPLLSQLALDDDREIQEVAIWSLGEIGGKEAMRVLNYLAEQANDDDDEALLDIIDDAIGNASFASGDLLFFDFDEE